MDNPNEKKSICEHYKTKLCGHGKMCHYGPDHDQICQFEIDDEIFRKENDPSYNMSISQFLEISKDKAKKEDMDKRMKEYQEKRTAWLDKLKEE